MAGMTPDEFFEGFVEEDFEDWKAEPDSIRRGFHLAVSAFHPADHYFSYHSRRLPAFAAKYKSLDRFQAALTARTPSFKIIQDVANTYKHLYPRASCSIASGGSIYSVTYDGQEIEQTWDQANGTYTCDIIIRQRDRSETRFSVAITAVMQMWTTIIGQDDPASA